MKKLVFASIAMLLVFAGCTGSSMPSDEAMDDDQMMESDEMHDDAMDDAAMDDQMESDTAENVLTISMESGNFFFAPDVIEAKVGQEIVLNIENDGFHDIVIDELGLNHKLEQGSNVVRFTPNEAGTFSYYCSVGNHRAQGMEGTLIVTE